MLPSCPPAPSPLFLPLAFFYSVLYVASLYIFVPAPTRALPRSDPRQIRARLAAALSTTALSLLSFLLLFCPGGVASPAYLGLPPAAFTSLLPPKPLLHVVSLYLGPLTLLLLSPLHLLSAPPSHGHSFPSYRAALAHVLTAEKGLPPTLNLSLWPPAKLRDLALGPLTEELCYRSLLLPLLLASGFGPRAAVGLSPLFFGFAHVHHGYRSYRGGLPLQQALLQAAFQFAYTSLFGLYCSYALLASGSVLGPFLAHSFCNFAGLPDLSYLSPLSREHKYRHAISAAYVLGIAMFAYGFRLMGGWEPAPAYRELIAAAEAGALS
jgi:prenyl protein peptidase